MMYSSRSQIRIWRQNFLRELYVRVVPKGSSGLVQYSLAFETFQTISAVKDISTRLTKR
jgi:hypothetical protein